MFMRAHASCMHAQVVFMCTHLCSSIHYGCMPQHAHACKTLRTHARDLYTHVGTQKPHLLSSLIFFTYFPYLIMILMLLFILFCRYYHLLQVGAILAIFLHGIRP